MNILFFMSFLSMISPASPNSQTVPSATLPPDDQLHEFHAPKLAPELDDQVINAFGLPAGNPPPITSSDQTNRQTPLSLDYIASQLRLQGLNREGEAIISSYLLRLHESLTIKVGQETARIYVKEIRETSVLLGWDKSDSTSSLDLPAPTDPVSLTSCASDIYLAKGLTISPPDFPQQRSPPVSLPSSTQPLYPPQKP